MIKNILLVGAFGFIGSVCRYLVYVWFSSRHFGNFPWATLAVNVLGCLLIGVIGTLVEKSIPNYQNLYLIASVGFLGAFTTFSTFGFETLNLIRFENLILALANVAANIIIGILAVYAGRNLANLF